VIRSSVIVFGIKRQISASHGVYPASPCSPAKESHGPHEAGVTHAVSAWSDTVVRERRDPAFGAYTNKYIVYAVVS